MFNIFKPPFEIETLNSWANLSDEIAKVSLLAMPVVLYAQNGIGWKLLNLLFLTIAVYLSLLFGRIFRKMKIHLQKEMKHHDA